VFIVVLFYNSSTNYSTNRGHPDIPVGGKSWFESKAGQIK